MSFLNSVKKFVKGVVEGDKSSSLNRKSLRLEALEERQLLTATSWSLDAADWNGATTFNLDYDGANMQLTDGTTVLTATIAAGDTIDITDVGGGKTLNISAAAMGQTLADLSFAGNGNDAVNINGTGNVDAFVIGAGSGVTTRPVYANNPYTNILNYYASVFGTQSRIYLNLETAFNNAWARLSTISVTSSTVTNTVTLNDGSDLTLSGANLATLNGLGGDDTFQVNGLGMNYAIEAGADNDTLSFANAPRVSIDMGSTAAQHAIVGQVGTIAINANIENVIGSANADRIVGSAAGSTINGNGGRDSIVLNGGVNNVTLNGNSQSVLCYGNGTYNVNITNGTYSVINAASATGILNLTAAGDHITVFGGRGNDTINLTGVYETVKAGAGDDTVFVSNAGASRFAWNRIYGDAGNDTISAFGANNMNFLYAGAGNDIVIGGAGTDYIYGISGSNILFGMDGTDYIFGGTGINTLVANTTTNTTGLQEAALIALLAPLDMTNLTAVQTALGTNSIADGDRDILYRGAGRTSNLGYLNTAADRDIAILYNFSIFNDIIVNG